MMDKKQIEVIDLKLKENSKEGRISCKVAQKIGDELSVPYKEIGARCQELNIKISACQLGCF
jgi:hypothetical protein